MKSDRESGSKPALVNARHQAHVLRSDFQTCIGGSKRQTFQTGSWVWPRHVTRPRSNHRTSLNQLPLLQLPSIPHLRMAAHQLRTAC
jgi:hypothetical protein